MQLYEMKELSWSNDAWGRLTADAGKLPHALLIHGPRGVGKLALAMRFARYVLCEASAGRPCGRCDACRWFGDGNHPDFRLLQPEALAPEDEGDEAAIEEPGAGRKRKPSLEIKVDQVRALADFLYVGSHRGSRRVALVHPAEAMNLNAANALLKGLEEPPPAAMFVLVAHDPARLLPTVRSRCVRLALGMPDADAALRWLKAEGVQDAAAWLAFAGGAPLLAREYASGERAAERLRMQEALLAGNGASLAVNDRESLELLLEVLQKHACDLAFRALAGRPKYGSAGRMPASRVSPAAMLAFARDMGRAREMARKPLNPRLFAAELLMRYAELSNAKV